MQTLWEFFTLFSFSLGEDHWEEIQLSEDRVNTTRGWTLSFIAASLHEIQSFGGIKNGAQYQDQMMNNI